MNMNKLVILIFFLFSLTMLTSCVATCPESILIRQHKVYSTLDVESKAVIEDIMRKAEGSARQIYYFEKLKLLLDTPEATTDVTIERNTKEIDWSLRVTIKDRIRAVLTNEADSVETYTNREELYELSKSREWHTYRPHLFGPYYYVSSDSNTDILINIKVKLLGKPETIKNILFLEDAIEKHLHVSGFSVNIIFTAAEGSDVFIVDTDPSKWATDENWSGGHITLAHELMHLMGLPDEYDRIESHADNKNLPVKIRLILFRMQMYDEVPLDSKYGIMCYPWLKPLERHVCEAAGLGDDCIKERRAIFSSGKNWRM